MSPYSLVAAVAVLSTLTGPALAQPVVSEPGYCAFYYPNANCNNEGAGNPYHDRGQTTVNQGYVLPPGEAVAVARKRRRSHAQ